MKKYAFPIGMAAGLVIGWLLGLVMKQTILGVIFGFFLGLGLTAVLLAWGEKGEAKAAALRALVGDPVRKDPGPPISTPIVSTVDRSSHHHRAPTRHRQATIYDDDDGFERDRAYDIGVAVGTAAMADEMAREAAEADYAAAMEAPMETYVEPEVTYEPEAQYREPEPTYSEPEPDWGGDDSSSDDSGSSDSSSD